MIVLRACETTVSFAREFLRGSVIYPSGTTARMGNQKGVPLVSPPRITFGGCFGAILPRLPSLQEMAQQLRVGPSRARV